MLIHLLVDTFKIPAGVSVYGGFAGNETSRDQRNILKYPTVLSGYTSDWNQTVWAAPTKFLVMLSLR